MVGARPNPDDLLRRVQAEERKKKRGQLTIVDEVLLGSGGIDIYATVGEPENEEPALPAPKPADAPSRDERGRDPHDGEERQASCRVRDR